MLSVFQSKGKLSDCSVSVAGNVSGDPHWVLCKRSVKGHLLATGSSPPPGAILPTGDSPHGLGFMAGLSPWASHSVPCQSKLAPNHCPASSP